MSTDIRKEYWKNNKLKEERHYQDSQLKLVKKWFQSGKLKSETNYGGLNNYVYREPPVSAFKFIAASILNIPQYSSYNIEKPKRRNQKNLRKGFDREWYENGQLSLEYSYAIALSNTDLRDEHYNLVKEYKEVRHGLCREWHPNGQVANEMTYEWGSLVGVWRSWNKNGEITFEKAV
tara:strand:+ start:158 stop:688 length:531 start_codon:yes stop_codon:yes gene_type:complete